MTSRISIAIVFTAIAGVFACAVYFCFGLCAVTVHNAGSRSISIVVRAANAYVGTASLQSGESMIRLFYPERDGEVSVTCSDQNERRTESFGYVTGGENVHYKIDITSCAAMTEIDKRYW